MRFLGPFFIAVLIMSHSPSFAQNPVDPDKAQILFNKIQRLYEPVAKADQGEFFLTIHWDRQTVAAQAIRDVMDKYGIGVDAGMLTSPRVNEDALALTLCHEAGHLFGGTPLRPTPPEWYGPTDESGLSLHSAEGQADYYSTAVCFRKVVAGEDHREILRGKEIPYRVVQLCDSTWGLRTSDSYLCQRAALAGLQFLTMVTDFPISFNTSDTTVADKTNNETYPARQCRLDTILAGALCQASLPLNLNRKDLPFSSCSEGISARPPCWFKKP
ncbi:hypothetical protein [Bdellovibrio sp. ArHS]|uniref:hypothetical protein n=1 Tax=Bdellovibrio sp. ArHS TaxID=1569284 RepID=UPI0025C3E37B|nr:hypothetical protein [Bdellovibrio sp. ArHS]